MRVLGIADHINCGSALVEDGTLVAAINDERLVRSKMVFGIPRESIKAIMQSESLSPDDIDAIAISTKNQHLINRYFEFGSGRFGVDGRAYKQLLFEVGSRAGNLRRRFPFIEKLFYLLRQPAYLQRRWKLRRILRSEFGFKCPIWFLDHHYCHAASTYYASGYQAATVLTMDSAGDAKSSKVYKVNAGKFEELHSTPSFDSLAKLYSYVTQICGFEPSKHEGKITGLAAYGSSRYQQQLQSIIARQNGHTKNVGYVYSSSAIQALERLLPQNFSHTDLAASVQIHTESIVTQLVQHWVRVTGHRDVALAGGLFGNVKVNQRIHELEEVRSVFVYPAMSDEGLPAGAAMAMYFDIGERSVPFRAKPLSHVYLGPSIKTGSIERALKNSDISATYYKGVEVEVAQLLSKGAVVARFAGRMEYGPRALGNRSILYQATDPSVMYWMNEALARTEFMPFAPVVLAEHAHRCFENLDGAENTARFMTITFQCTDWMIRHAPAVVHVDGTARPQIVSREDNPTMWKILTEYYELTSIPCLINTSFNMHEEPIVYTPADAARAFKASRLDYLAIGNWIAKHPDPIERKVDHQRLDFYLERQGPVRI